MKKEDKYPNLSKERRIELLKDAIDVSGKRLLPVDIKDDVISLQIFSHDSMIYHTADEINAKETKIYNEAIKKDPKLVIHFIEKQVKSYFMSYSFDPDFWSNFSSAPYYQRCEDEKGKKGGVGMDTIFGDRFEKIDNYASINLIEKLKYSVEIYHKSKVKIQTKPSKYNSLEEIKKELSEINRQATLYYKDETNGFDERIEVFTEFGEKDGCIHHPNDPKLRKIFDIMFEQDYWDRHQTIECIHVVDCWVEFLEYDRCKISYNKNEYHPEILKTKRNYTPSKEAIERLKRHYHNIILKENVAKFELDW